MKKPLLLFLALAGLAAWAPLPAQMIIHGHRGARSQYPENSIPGFRYAFSTGINTVELDLVVNANGELLVSHDPWFESRICLDSAGMVIPKGKEKEHVIYRMKQSQIEKYDCGCRGHPGFPEQRNVSVHKPLLSEVVRACDSLPGPVPHFNLEIKSRPGWEGEMQPPAREYARLVYDEIVRLGLKERVIVQSFDKRVLREMHSLDPSLSYGLLVADPRGVKKQIEGLGFRPDFYNPHYKLIGKRKLRKAHEMDLRVIVWTVNEQKLMRKMARLGVDGIITDDPALAVRVLGTPASGPQ